MAGEDELDLLAAEYVLGVLTAEERATVERRLVSDADLAARVAAWQERFVPLAEDLAPLTPHPQVWQRIRRSIANESSEHRPPWWSRMGFWRGWAGLATAAALGLAVIMLSPAPAPQLVAVLTNTEGSPIWVVRAATGGGDLLAQPLAEGADPARVPQLWLLPVGAQRPVSLDVRDPGGANRRTLESLSANTLGPGALLEVSLEPPGGSPTGLPTGPVISKGFLVAPP